MKYSISKLPRLGVLVNDYQALYEGVLNWEEVPQFSFEVIAAGDPVAIQYFPHYPNAEIGFFFPCVISDVREGEYDDRRFAVIYAIILPGENPRWGLLQGEDKILENFFNFLGFNSLEAQVDTCVYGKASPPTPDQGVEFFSQRKSCEKCR